VHKHRIGGRAALAFVEEQHCPPVLSRLVHRGSERGIPEGGFFRAKAEVIPAFLGSGQLLACGSNFAG
jgi:hypothetical protein